MTKLMKGTDILSASLIFWGYEREETNHVKQLLRVDSLVGDIRIYQ